MRIRHEIRRNTQDNQQGRTGRAPPGTVMSRSVTLGRQGGGRLITRSRSPPGSKPCSFHCGCNCMTQRKGQPAWRHLPVSCSSTSRVSPVSQVLEREWVSLCCHSNCSTITNWHDIRHEIRQNTHRTISRGVPVIAPPGTVSP
jgi:hypothetical protein